MSIAALLALVATGCGAQSHKPELAAPRPISFRDEEGITLRVDLDALICRERLTQDAAMRHQHPRVLLGAQVMQQLRRTLDVGEEEADSARRQVAHLRQELRFLLPNAS